MTNFLMGRFTWRRSLAKERRAALLRVARQVARDQQVRPPPEITLPRLACLEEDCDTAVHGLERAPERAA